MTIEDVAIPSDPDALRRAALAGVENVREAWVALRMIREALEAKGPVREADGLSLIDEAEALVDAVVRL